jgi:hypothetical protein
MTVESLSRGEKEEMLTLIEDRAIKVPAENSKPIPGKATDEAEARPLAGKADAYDAALTALREDTRHWWGGARPRPR